jgi:hypothetical protein
MTNRIFSEAYDTALQKDYYENKCNGDVDRFVGELSSKLKSDMLFLGKIVLTDAQFYDSPLLHMMKEDEFSAFKRFVWESNGAVEVRCRPNTLPEMLGKQFRYSSVRCEKLSDALYSIGETLGENGGSVTENSATSLVAAIKEYSDGRLYGVESEFEEFAARLCQLAEFRKDNAQSFVEWDVAVNERLNTRQDFADLPAVMNTKREFLLGRLRDFEKLLKEENITKIEKELKKTSGFPNASVIKAQSCNAPEFFREFRHWYNIGLASQHFADSPCLFDCENLNINKNSENTASSNEASSFFVLNVDGGKYEELFRSRWSDFILHFTDVTTTRDAMWGAYKAGNAEDYKAAIEEYISKACMPLICESISRIESLFNDREINSTTAGVSTEQTSKSVFKDIQKDNSCSVILPESKKYVKMLKMSKVLEK